MNREKVHREQEELDRSHRREYGGLMLVGILLTAIGLKYSLWTMLAIGVILFGASFVGIVFTFMQRRQTDNLLDVTEGKQTDQSEDAVQAVGHNQHFYRSRFQDSTGGGFDDSNFP